MLHLNKLTFFAFCVYILLTFSCTHDNTNYQNQKELFAFSKQHKDVWKELSLKQFGGKYSKYSYDFFQRGRVYFNSATKQHFIVMNDLRKNIPNTVLSKISKLIQF